MLIQILIRMLPVIVAALGSGWSNLAHAAHNSPRKRGEVRVVVTFKQEFSSTDRQALHLALKMGFKRHYKSTHSDLAHVSWDRALSKTEARERAQAICKRYLESPLVQSCVPAI